MQQHQQHLTKLIQTAASSKDTQNTREQQLHPLLSLLIGGTGEPWFSAWLDTTLASIYPQPSRTLLDAVLQAYIAAAPAHCSHVLQSMLRIPGSTSLNAPLRRDVAVLFRPNPQLHASWQQQGAVCCSIVAFLANHAASHFPAYQHHHQQQQQQQDMFGGSGAPAQPRAAAAAQHAGTAIGWLADCLLQAAPEDKLQLLQIALATFVHRSTVLHAQQRVEQQQANDKIEAEPPAKRMRMEQQQEAQAVQSATAVTQHTDTAQKQAPGAEPADAAAGNTSSFSCGWQPASRAAILTGLQFLCAVSSCESFQRDTQQLLPLAAVLAAQTAAASEAHFSTVSDSRLFSWLVLQLCSQVSATAQPAAAAAAAGAAIAYSGNSTAGSVTAAAAASAMPAAALPGSKQQQQSLGLAAPTAPGLTPAAALYQVVQHLSSVGPTQLLQVVSTQLMQAHNMVPGEVSTHPVKSAVASMTSAQQQSSEDAIFQAWLLEAAKQWHQTRPAAGTSAISSAGSKRGKGRAGKGAGSAAAGQRHALGIQQLLPAAPAVTASWVCKHLVACLCQQAALDWQQQRQQPQQEEGSSAAASPAVAALAQLLAADGLLLPPSGEVLVSARALAEALSILPVDLQEHLVRHWQQLLSKPQAAVAAAGAVPKAAAGGEGSAPGTAATDVEGEVLLPWATLQPMLCLLNHINDLDASPVAAFLTAAVYSCLQVAQQARVSGTAAARPGSGQGSGAGSSVKDIVRHVLLPLRFKLQVQARVWLLQQLLCAGQGLGFVQGCDPVSSQVDWTAGLPAAGVGSTSDDAARTHVLQAVVELLSKDCAGQLSQGLQLLAEEQEAPAGHQDSAASAGTMQLQQARGLADAVLQLLKQLCGCEVDVEMSQEASGQGAAASAAAAAEQLRAVLVGAAGAAVCEKLGVR